MANTIRPKRSTTASAVPSAGSLAEFEIAVNTTDQAVYMKVGSSVVKVAGTGVRPGEPAAFNTAGFSMGGNTLGADSFASAGTFAWQMTASSGAVPVVSVSDVLDWGNPGTTKNLRIRAGYIGVGNNINAQALLVASGFTTDRVHALPDKNGTYAMLDDVPVVGSGFLAGFEVRSNGTTLVIGPGRAGIQSRGDLPPIASAGTTINLSRASNTWYYLYVDASGTITRSTTAPAAAAYYGAARSMNGNTSQRFLCAIRTSGTSYWVGHLPPANGSGPAKWTFLYNVAVSNRIISNGNSATPADVNMSSWAPANVTISGTFRIQNNNASATLRYYTWNGSSFVIYSNILGVNIIVVDVYCDSTPKIQYDEPSGLTSAFIDLLAYTFYR